MTTWELIARGRVQGVGFRWFVQRAAHELGVCGYVRNMSDGSVKILAQVDAHLFESFQMQIKSGSQHARVDALEVMELESAKKYNEFEIK